MNMLTIGARNICRNKLRSALTVLGAALAVLSFILLRTVVWAWNMSTEVAAQDRLATHHKVSFALPMPRRYVDTIRQAPGISHATWATWFGGKDPLHPNESFPVLAVDPESFLHVYDEASITPDEKTRWLLDRHGAIIGDLLAQRLGLRVGDKAILQGTIYPGDWEFQIDGIYHVTRPSMQRSDFLFHWSYLNDALPASRKDQVGWITSRVGDARSSASIAVAVNGIFEEKDVPATTVTERAVNKSFLGMFSSILVVLDSASTIVLGIMTLVLGNTVALGMRERKREYAVLRALGFAPRKVATLLLGEGVTIGTVSGALGIALSYPIVQLGLGAWLEQNFSSWFPYFRIDFKIALTTATLSVIGGTLSAVPAAITVSKLSVIDTLREVG